VVDSVGNPEGLPTEPEYYPLPGRPIIMAGPE